MHDDFKENGFEVKKTIRQSFKMSRLVFIHVMKEIKKELAVEDEPLFDLALDKLMLKPSDVNKPGCQLI